MDFEDHLFGGVGFAVACVNEDGCNFLAFDCDEDFALRLPIYGEVLGRRGLAQAAFGTTGSTSGRGKVIVTLAKRLPQSYAIELAKEIQDETIAHPDFGITRPGSLTAFPSGGDGSYCRIGGSKYGPNGQRELFIDLKGYETDLAVIVPAILEVGHTPTIKVISEKRSKTDLSSWAQVVLSQPFTGTEPDLLKVQLRLVSEAVQVVGEDAESTFMEWMEQIAKNSPTLSNSVQRQLHRTDTFQKALARISKAKPPKAWEPLRPPYTPGVTYKVVDKGVNKVAKGAERVYSSLAAYVLAHHLNPHAISMDYERLTALTGYSDKSTTHKAALKAEAAELLFILDKGKPRSKNCPGVSALFCLRGEGETMEQAMVAGKRSRHFQGRTESKESRPTPQALYTGALTWNELLNQDPQRYGQVCELLRESMYLPEQLLHHSELKAA